MSDLDFALRFELEDLYSSYASCIDEGRFEDWPDFFTEDCAYRVLPRENYDAGRPLGTISLDGRPMLRDRAYGVMETLFHAPYYQRHIVSGISITNRSGDRVGATANYVVFRTKRNELTDILNAGRYVDQVVRTPDGLRFAERLCIFDSEMIPNSLIYPI